MELREGRGVKFLCDRCKTRYSIGDERVRGKILKIRCKNCANVITVREGMPDADGGVPRKTNTTTAIPLVQQTPLPKTASPARAAAPAKNALGAAFASAMTQPPPAALEEEWYVSIDGEQEGPFSLAEAQRWVAAKPFDADLYCWSEGFDDWLPVDKVSHFRGRRKKPAPPAMPPPVPRNGPGQPRAITAAAPRGMQVAAMATPEPDPKPLFAATLASLEKSAPAPKKLPGLGSMRADARNGRVPVPAAAEPVPTTRGLGLPTPRPGALSNALPTFDDRDELDEGKTQIEAPTFDPPAKPTAEPAANAFSQPLGSSVGPGPAATMPVPAAAPPAAAAPARARPQRSLSSLVAELEEEPATVPSTDPGAAAALAAALEASKAAATPTPTPALDDDDDDDGDLDIGEVSRVVRIADLMKAKPAPAAAAARRTGAVPKLNGSGLVPVPLIDAVDAPPSANPLAEPSTEIPPIAPAVAASHRRGMIALIVGAVLLIGAAAAFVFIKLNRENGETSLGGEYTLNGQRPDDPIRRIIEKSGSAEPAPNPFIPPRPIIRRPPVKPPDPPPSGNSLGVDDIESMARSTSSTTTACFRRADRGADAIRLADIKKIKVTFRVAPDGTVSNVTLSEKGSKSLTSCLTRMIQGWRFKPNSGGNFGFVFAKPG